jgi:hypothetical protein
MTPRKGKHVRSLMAYAAEHPGCQASEAIRACGIEQRQGYFSVECATAGGFLWAERRDRGIYLWPARKGPEQIIGQQNLKSENGS